MRSESPLTACHDIALPTGVWMCRLALQNHRMPSGVISSAPSTRFLPYRPMPIFSRSLGSSWQNHYCADRKATASRPRTPPVQDAYAYLRGSFGKFGPHYLQQTYYFDVHPPLGKLLVGLSGYIAGYNGSFEFKSGEQYPPELDFWTMRAFNAMFGIFTVPMA